MPVPYRQQNGGHHLRATLALAGLIALVLGLAFAALTPQVGVEQATRETARAPKQAPPGDKTLEKTVDKTKDDFWARHSYQDIARAKAPFFRAEKDGSLRCNSRVIGAILKDSGGLPTRTYKQSSGRFCRIFAIQALIQGQAVRRFATACRQPRGAWSKLG